MRSNNEFGAGDVSSSICDFGSMTVQEKKSLASKLSDRSAESTFVQGAHGWLASRRRSPTVPMVCSMAVRNDGLSLIHI